jgi:hypothetical protein
MKQRNRKRISLEVNSRVHTFTRWPLLIVNLLVSESLIGKTLQSFMFKPTADFENVQRNNNKKKGRN